MLVGLFYQHIGLSKSITLPKDSYMQQYFDDLNNYLRTGPPVYFVIKGGYNYTSQSNQNKVLLIVVYVEMCIIYYVVFRSAHQLDVTATLWVCRYPMQR